jgi:hypothetical protein
MMHLPYCPNARRWNTSAALKIPKAVYVFADPRNVKNFTVLPALDGSAVRTT